MSGHSRPAAVRRVRSAERRNGRAGTGDAPHVSPAPAPVRRFGAVPAARQSVSDRRVAEVVRAPAVIDLATGPALAHAIAAARRRHPRCLVVDLSGVEFCDSTALKVLVDAADELVEDRCVLELHDPPPMLVRMASLLALSVRLGLPG